MSIMFTDPVFINQSREMFSRLACAVLHPVIQDRLAQKYRDKAREVLLTAILGQDVQINLEDAERLSQTRYRAFCEENRNKTMAELLDNMDVSVCCVVLLFRDLVELSYNEKNAVHDIRQKRNDIAHAMNMQMSISEESKALWLENRDTLSALESVFKTYVEEDVSEQIQQYYNGQLREFRKPIRSISEKFDYLVDKGAFDQAVTMLIDHDQLELLTQKGYVNGTSQMNEKRHEILTHYIETAPTGGERVVKLLVYLSERRPDIWGMHYVKLAPWKTARTFGKKFAKTQPGFSREVYECLSQRSVREGIAAEQRAFDRKGLRFGSERCGRKCIADLNGHLNDLVNVNWDETSPEDISALLNYLDGTGAKVAFQAGLVQCHKALWQQLEQSPLSEQLAWFLNVGRQHPIYRQYEQLQEEYEGFVSRLDARYWEEELTRLQSYMKLSYPDTVFYKRPLAQTESALPNQAEAYEVWKTNYEAFEQRRQEEATELEVQMKHEDYLRAVQNAQVEELLNRMEEGLAEQQSLLDRISSEIPSRINRKQVAEVLSTCRELNRRFTAVTNHVDESYGKLLSAKNNLGFMAFEDGGIEENKKVYWALLEKMDPLLQKKRDGIKSVTEAQENLSQLLQTLPERLKETEQLRACMKMAGIGIAVAAVLVLAVCGGVYGFRMYRTNHADACFEEGGAALLEAYRIYDDFAADGNKKMEARRVTCLQKIRESMLQGGYKSNENIHPGFVEDGMRELEVVQDTDGTYTVPLGDWLEAFQVSLRLPGAYTVQRLWMSESTIPIQSFSYGHHNVRYIAYCSDGTVLEGALTFNFDNNYSWYAAKAAQQGVDMVVTGHFDGLKDLVIPFADDMCWYWLDDSSVYYGDTLIYQGVAGFVDGEVYSPRRANGTIPLNLNEDERALKAAREAGVELWDRYIGTDGRLYERGRPSDENDYLFENTSGRNVSVYDLKPEHWTW